MTSIPIVEKATTLAGGLKRAYEISQKLKHADLNDLIADLRLQAADLKNEIVQLREDKLELERQLNECQKLRDIRSKVVFRDNAYYATEPIEGYGEGPFCSGCLDNNGRLINLHYDSGHTFGANNLRTRAFWVCPQCGKKFFKKD